MPSGFWGVIEMGFWGLFEDRRSARSGSGAESASFGPGAGVAGVLPGTGRLGLLRAVRFPRLSLDSQLSLRTE